MGELNVLSRQGEPLVAEVEIDDTPAGQADSAVPAIGSPDIYRVLGLVYPDALREARVVRDRRYPDGRWVARVAGVRPVQDPGVVLVVVLDGPAGRQVRTYRVDLPPPRAAARTGEADAGASAVGGGATAASADLPRVSVTVPPASSSAPAEAAGSDRARGPAPSVVPSPAAAPGASGSVIVAPGDTATTIARRFAPGDVTDAQAVMALYRANRREFAGSVHRLPAGAVLAIPGGDAMRALSAGRARAELRAQGPVPGRALAAGSAPGGDRLQLSGGGRGRGTASAGGGGDGAAQRAIAFEAAMSEANSRIAQLESIVAGLRKLIEARDRRMAEMIAELNAIGRPASPSASADRSALVPAAGAGPAGSGPTGARPVGAATATMLPAPSRSASPLPQPGGSEDATIAQTRLALLAAAALLALIVVFWWIRRRRGHRQAAKDETISSGTLFAYSEPVVTRR